VGIDVWVLLAVFAVLFGLLTLGVPVALALAGAGITGMVMLDGFAATTGAISGRLFMSVFSFSLIVIPLFVIMGFLMGSTDIGADLFAGLARITRRIPGGLGIASIGTCAAFGAVTGSSITAVAAVGPISIREMRRFGYTKELASGIIASAGTLGILIPPSIALVLYGFIAEVSISRLLIAGFLPGIFSGVLYGVLVYFLDLRSRRKDPSRKQKFDDALALSGWTASGKAGTGAEAGGASIGSGGDSTGGAEAPAVGLFRMPKTTSALLKIAFLFFVVFGGIYSGLATVTESAALGALGAAILVFTDVGRNGFAKTVRTFRRAVQQSLGVSSMFFLLLVGGAIFGNYLLISRIPTTFTRFVTGLEARAIFVMLIIFAGLILLGMFLDGISILLITVPLLFPIVVTGFGFNEIWFGIMLVKVIEIGLITPPLGINAYVVSSIVDDIPVESVFRGALPFIAVDIVTVSILYAFPQIVTFLPDKMLGA
jgi:C4-dicarboxylate transporter DctM subunit